MLAVEGEEGTEWLPVDVATDYRRNGRVWFTAEELLQGRRRWKNFWVAAPEVEFQYLLVKRILKAKVPARARERLEALAAELGARAEELAQGLLGDRWGREVPSWVRASAWEQFEGATAQLRRALLWRRFQQDPLNPLRYWLPEFWRIWQRWRRPTGLFVAVLGPDGAGKSTLIENLREGLRGAFRRTAVFHFRPRLWGGRAGSAPVSSPHGEPPRSWLASVAKAALYALDYILGHWVKVRPALVRSTLVLFDRYWDDLLVDPKRYRYGGPMSWVKWLGRFVPKPDLFLVLDVCEEEVQKRKEEISLDELQHQRRAYQKLAAHLGNAVLLDGSASAEEVARRAADKVLEHLALRVLGRM
ncbi:MAG: hypothetical protein QN210_11240 [Armatimonadota bacterium]|nr:hypothetical protein [Armatimonadota bacterium]MDR7612970.1 hypothetical protein [Armatimonadota bacterium]